MLPTAECFNLSTKKWTCLPPMKTARKGAAAVEFNEELYVIGGTKALPVDFTNAAELLRSSVIDELVSVEKYNPHRAIWTEVANLKHGRMNHCAAVCNKQIYVVGGFTEVIEAYDPLQNQWTYHSILPRSKSISRFISLDHKTGDNAS